MSFMFAGGQTNGDGGIHKPSGQWMKVSFPKSSMLVPGGHKDEDEATEIFCRVMFAKLSPKMPHPWVRKSRVLGACVRVFGPNILG